MIKIRKTASKQLSLFMACAACFICSISAQSQNREPAQDERTPALIETFTLDQAQPRREFFDGRLKIELMSSTSKDYLKTIKVRISSDMIKAEYHDEWQEHTFLEMTRYYIGDPVSGSPFKCSEGWIYYTSSKDGAVTLSLHAGPEPVGSGWYKFNLLLMKNWQYAVMALAASGLGFFLYYFIPFIWTFISIQIQARSHALATGFKSSMILVYILKKIPLLVCMYIFFHFFFNYGWKGVALSLLTAIGMQIYFNFHNKNILATYARIKHFTTVEGTGERAFTGEIKGMPVSVAVGGSFIWDPYSSGSGSGYTHMSYLIIQVTLKNPEWNGLEIYRDKSNKFGWVSSLSLDQCPGTGPALSALSRLHRYSIGKFEVIEGKLSTVKVFAPDTPAEINLLADLVADLAISLDRKKKQHRPLKNA